MERCGEAPEFVPTLHMIIQNKILNLPITGSQKNVVNVQKVTKIDFNKKPQIDTELIWIKLYVDIIEPYKYVGNRDIIKPLLKSSLHHIF